VVINQISPILVRFPVPAAYFDRVRQRANQSLEVAATPVGDSTRAEKGLLVFLDNAVDSMTGTVTLKASFANKSGALWPGALEAVSLQLDVEKDVLVVPASAVQTGQSGSVVWIVDSARKVHVVKVVVTRSTDSLAVLAGGVMPGQHVVIDGQLRLTDGVTVAVRPDSPPGGAKDTGAQRGRGKTP
jgi:multidrug efflux system membrane fusion protein